ncbi:MAG: hypothetical protein ACTS2F_06375 [Thainema sp.]
MKFDWDDYLEVANELFLDSQKKEERREAKARSSISRAYYSAFCVARSHLGMQNKDANVHRDVITSLQSSSNRELQRAGEWLGRLRGSRNDADYEDNCLNNYISKSKQALKDAKAIKDILRQENKS